MLIKHCSKLEKWGEPMNFTNLYKYKKIYNIAICAFIVIFSINVVLTFVYKDRYRSRGVVSSTDNSIAFTNGTDTASDKKIDNIEIVFKDPNFEKIIRYNLMKPEVKIYVKDVRKITYLNLNHSDIKSIEDLKYFKSLRKLDISFNKVKDLSETKRLINLQELIANDNQIEDISSLSEVKTLKKLDISNNFITDITPLTSLKNLVELDVNNNKVKSVGKLSELPNLKVLDISRNNIEDMDSLNSKNYKLLLNWGNKFN